MQLLPPKDIPDLSSLQAQAEIAAIMRGLAGGGSADPVAHTLTINSVRLLDAAIRDYSLGREAILEFYSRDPREFGISYTMQATTHFESCIWHLERFIKHAHALRSGKNTESELKALIPRNLSFLSQSAERQITRLRHTLAHLEEVASRGELAQGVAIALMPIEDGLSISDQIMQWQDLVQWLRDAHSCTKKIAQFKPQKKGSLK